ncbi:hypothetical protein [Streptomyces rimosus]|uniref:hypothetical protein n=1 Tax=Streptomyces rimosus TaxID=1927 RepID=UPI000B12DC6B|nr:hypothetical protein [Streptomyces rimosus]
MSAAGVRAVAETGQSQAAAGRIHVLLHDRIDLLLTVVRTAGDDGLVAALTGLAQAVDAAPPTTARASCADMAQTH